MLIDALILIMFKAGYTEFLPFDFLDFFDIIEAHEKELMINYAKENLVDAMLELDEYLVENDDLEVKLIDGVLEKAIAFNIVDYDGTIIRIALEVRKKLLNDTYEY